MVPSYVEVVVVEGGSSVVQLVSRARITSAASSPVVEVRRVMVGIQVENREAG